MVRPLSEQLADLSARAHKAEESIAAASREGKAKLEARKAELETSASERAERLKGDLAGAGDSVSSKWSELEGKVRSDMHGIRSHIDEMKDEHDAKRVEKRAERAEDNAGHAIAFALAAIDNAENALLDAVLARAQADSL